MKKKIHYHLIQELNISLFYSLITNLSKTNKYPTEREVRGVSKLYPVLLAQVGVADVLITFSNASLHVQSKQQIIIQP